MYGQKDSEIGGFQFFDRNGNKILEAGLICDGKPKVIELAEGERLVGIKSYLLNGYGSS
jgi:hypothetical protein